ncbi:MAG: hypothetical protein CL927_15020 [Deltaproteobacteria bacterium]|nr:hypothetical protein [Deltaproteobacteria bacterium]
MSDETVSAGPDGLQVTVLLFAALREQLGEPQVERRVPTGITARALYESMFPATSAGRMPVMFAVDEVYAAPETVLHDGATVAFLPPLGGG